MKPKTCTVGPNAVTGERCGKPAVTTFTTRGKTYAECAEHDVGGRKVVDGINHAEVKRAVGAPKARLTPHQAEVLGRCRSTMRRLKGPFEAKHVRSTTAIAHLARKGYLVTETRYGPRGGVQVWITQVLG